MHWEEGDLALGGIASLSAVGISAFKTEREDLENCIYRWHGTVGRGGIGGSFVVGGNSCATEQNIFSLHIAYHVYLYYVAFTHTFCALLRTHFCP